MDRSNSLISSENRRPILFYTLCIYAAMWLLASVHSAIGTYQTAIIDAFSLESSQKGLPSSTLSLFTILTFAVVLLTTGRFKKIAALTLGLALGCISLTGVLFAWNSPFGLFLALIAVAGIACGAIDSLNSAVINELYPGKSGVMCLLHATYGLAGFSMPFLLKLLFREHPEINGPFPYGTWRSAFALIGGAMGVLCAALLFLKFRYKDKIEAAPRQDQRISRAMIKQVLGAKALWPILISSVLGGMYMNSLLVWTPRFIEFGHSGASYKDWALPVVYLSITVSRLLMSFIKPKLGKTLKLLMPFAALFLLAAILVKAPLIALVFVFLSVFCYAPVIPFQVTMAGEALPERRFVVTIILMFVMMLGQTVISPIIGLAESAWGINGAMYIAALMMALSWAAAMFIKEAGN